MINSREKNDIAQIKDYSKGLPFLPVHAAELLSMDQSVAA